ncbi:MAG: hypothetical protein JKY66_04745 [Spongiibacteraceae bacterium]|nr:hypothetical protein [Spongiibacteraceae bacterium]
MLSKRTYLPGTFLLLSYITLFSAYVIAEKDNRMELDQCAAIVDSASRLECFDRLVLEIRSVDVGDKKTVNHLPVDTFPASKLQNAESSQQPMGAAVQQQMGTKYLKSSRPSEPNELGLQLIGMKKDRRGRWAFRFDNGQVWRQTEAGYMVKLKQVPVQATLSKAFLGSYTLRILGVSKQIKVKRIQ